MPAFERILEVFAEILEQDPLLLGREDAPRLYAAILGAAQERIRACNAMPHAQSVA